MVDETFIEVAEARIWTATQGAGRPIILCPGGPGNRDYLAPVAEMIDDIATVHRFDPRGCGRSSGTGPYTVRGWVEDLERLRTHWGHDSWIVLGHSFGSHLALQYASTHPDQTAGVA